MAAHKPEDIHKLWAEAFDAGDLEALLSLYEPTARIVPKPGEPAVGGSPEVLREVLSGFLAVRGTIEIKTTSVIETGELALLCSEWRLRGTSPHGRAVDVTHRSAEVVRRQPDGTWRYLIDNPFGAD
jgi:ketosteroid isomerase-like protein